MNRSLLSAVAITAGLSGWMISGMYTQAGEPVAGEKKAAEAPRMKVEVISSSAHPVQRTVSVQGQVEALRSVQIKAEVDGRVEALPVTEGARVKAGDQLVRLAEDFRPAQLKEARARLAQRESDLRASLKLKKRGLQAENQIVADRAEVEAARAQLAQIRYQLEHTRIEAPFAGVLNRRSVELGDFVERGMQVAELVDDEQLVVAGQVPQHYAPGLNVGQAVQVALVTGETMQGSLKFISATADADTRSYRVEVALDNPDHRRLIGLSASLQLPIAEMAGHWVPGSVLGLKTDGTLQVKTLDEQNRVVERSVELIRTDKDGFWVGGLPEQITLVSTGQHFVGSGDLVEAVDRSSQSEGESHARID